MLDWTGERFVPWAQEPAVAYEHLHRYLWVSRLLKDKNVLDLACGEGYGANILAHQAASVCGVDIDEAAVRHASEKYIRSNLRFLTGSLAQLPIPGENTFDVIVCFEAIEHVREHDAVLCEVKRLLKPDGLFVISTPNKEVYRQDEPENPFHVRELTFAEFDALIKRYFSKVHYFGQRVHPGSSIWPLGTPDGSSVHEFTIERIRGEFQPVTTDEREAVYYVAVASDTAGRAPEGSVLLDRSDELIRALEQEAESLRHQVQQRDEALAWRESCVEDLERKVAAWSREGERLNSELELKRQELSKIYESWEWRLVLKFRALKKRAFSLWGKVV